ncbi:hypothetical protein NQ315_009836 [Exocentrus adspersus]|uniref:Uncharacterized protein n=1 Tax=Exocentrus adspersus TaxID=1586481 RepID=A0AAV8WHQ4_9CUCU|nr:hypothetical protein NQ315_009836 [Exocentrus adspersus]
MTASNTPSLSACSFPSVGTDEESFVVLWKDGQEKSGEPTTTGVAEEAKQLINKELAEIDQSNLAGKSSGNIESSPSIPLEQSISLLKMPEVDRVLDPRDIISIMDLSTDASLEQVQHKISLIVEENNHLKEKIIQNNATMKSQYERMVAWQEEAEKIHQMHKQKLLEAKEFIEKLKKENNDVTREVEQVQASIKAQELELTYLRQALREQEQCNDCKQVMNEVQAYEKEINDVRSALQASRREIEEVKMESQKKQSVNEEKLSALNEVVDALRSQLYFTSQQQNMLPSSEEMDSIRERLASANVALVQMEHSKNAALSEVESLNREISELINAPPTQADEIYALKAQLETYKADFEAEKKTMELIKVQNEKLSADVKHLQRQNQQLQNVIRDNECVVS